MWYNYKDWLWGVTKLHFTNIYIEYHKKEERYKSALEYIHNELNRQSNEMGKSNYVRDPFAFIEYRVKDFDSAIAKYNKRHNGNSPKTISDIENTVRDIAGIRIICHYLDDIYLVEEMIRMIPAVEVIEEERDDYIEKPKPTGYSSLHLTILVDKSTIVEVQIRSMLMHSWSRLEHYLRYKNSEPKASTIKMLEYSAKMFRSMDKLLIILRDRGNEDDEKAIEEAISDIEKVRNSLNN